jgi:preprotein translocase subunit YajC
MYFLFLRPQMKARKEQDKMISELKSGDDVITQSGIYGTITNVKEKTFLVRIADNVKVEMLKSSVTGVTKRDTSEPAS